MSSNNKPSTTAENPSAVPEIEHTDHVSQVMSNDMEMNKADYGRIDREVAEYAGTDHIEIDEQTNKRLKTMIDKRILVIMVITYFMQALDKGTISFVSIMKLPEDTNLKGQEFSWLTTCIYIAILVFEFPTNWLLQRVPIAKYLAFNIIGWGITLACHAACPNFASLLVVRTLLGLFETCCQPSFIILSSMWYKRSEQAGAVTYWYMMNGGQQIVGGLLAYCFSLIESGPLRSWQAIFIAYGGITVFWGVFVWYWMPDSPMRAKCFTEADKRLMVERVRENQTGLQNKVFRREQAMEALRDPQTWGYCLISICTTLPTSGLGAFKSIIISGFHFTVLQTQLLAMVLGAYIIIVLFSSLYIVKKTGQNLITMGVYAIPSFVGTIVMMTVENTNAGTRIGLLISYYIALSFWSAQTLALSMISRNVAGMTKKSVVVAANFVSWATAAAIGPQVFLSWDAPRYFIAFATHLGCYTLLVIVICALRWHLKRENSKKDAVQTEGLNLRHAFEDLTDRENPNFRYIF
ncbi:major facilitator superfamily domain-containing protein [Hypoxylon rubiginosum]|uniref:Major facilitator superfamily domain-containing protein n=1 Tax=Hypoxylon rubiginosum TaxID=110542 RepID=A0ACC0CZ04_9PEZI|nr:major facilitator superfamily domain-containing protein [Hypoxylon rubiginosum]